MSSSSDAARPTVVRDKQATSGEAEAATIIDETGGPLTSDRGRTQIAAQGGGKDRRAGRA